MSDGSTGKSAPRRLARRYLATALLVAVAAFQMWRVEVDGLTRWRGGGFGMYSSVHYTENRIWVGVDGPSGQRFAPMGTPATPAGRALVPRCRVFPTEESLAELAQHLSPRVQSLQIWRPRLDPETLEFDRVLVAEWRR